MVIRSLFSILIPGHVARVVREDYLASELAIGVDFCELAYYLAITRDRLVL